MIEFKEDTIGDILDSEREMILHGADLYGEYFINASEFSYLLNDFVKSVDFDRYLFAVFLSHLRKCNKLALFSAVRRHHVQMALDLRQVLEAGASAAYAIAIPNIDHFVEKDQDGILLWPKRLTKKRNIWLEKNFPAENKSIKGLKDMINDSCGHANVVYGFKTFKFDDDMKNFGTPFFDIFDETHIKSDLWLVANIAMGLMDLFYGINRSLNVIKFSDDYASRFKILEKQNLKLKNEMLKNPNFAEFLSR